MNQQKISIIVPIYNVAEYLPKCIESIINQTYSNLEIILINDGSTDESQNICEKYLNIDSRIILINQKNQGLSMARNNGMEIATGDYIGFVDSDDFIDFNMYETLLDKLCKYDADISICNINYVNKYGEFILNKNGEEAFREYKINAKKDLLLSRDDIIEYFVYSNNNFMWNKLYKRVLFDDICFPKNKYFEDVFTSYKIFDKTKKIYISSEYKYNYLQREDSITNTSFKKSHFDIVEAYKERYEVLASKYPELKLKLKEYIFDGLMNCIYKSYTSGNIKSYNKEIEEMIEDIKTYEISDCNLSEGQKNILKIIFKDFNEYLKILKFYYSIYDMNLSLR